MQLWLIDTNPALVNAWKKAFAGFSKVFVCEGDILNAAENTIVSPAIAYDFKDGGIDRLYAEFFGPRPQMEAQRKIQERPDGLLPVGTGLLVKTGSLKIPYMIVAPATASPQRVMPHNCFFAMAAVLQVAWLNRKKVCTVFCPGLATGNGGVPPEDAAREMAFAYRKWCGKYNIQG